MSGSIVSIHIAREKGAPMQAVPHAVALPGLGLEGDCYAIGKGEFSNWPQDHELTLIEAETIERVALEHGLQLQPGETRRNLTTRGVALNDLVGRTFLVGEVRCIGTRLCHPCAYLERVTARYGLARLIAGYGGLRARILTDGVIFEGDDIVVLA